MKQFHSFLSGLERTDAGTKLGWSEVMRWKQRLPVLLSPVVLCHTYCISAITDHHVYKPFQNERSWETQWAVHRLHGAARLCQTPHGWSVSVCLILFHAVVSATQRTGSLTPAERHHIISVQNYVWNLKRDSTILTDATQQSTPTKIPFLFSFMNLNREIFATLYAYLKKHVTSLRCGWIVRWDQEPKLHLLISKVRIRMPTLSVCWILKHLWLEVTEFLSSPATVNRMCVSWAKNIKLSKSACLQE